MSNTMTIKQMIDAQCALALNEALKHFGNQNKLAKAVGVTRQAVNAWVKAKKIGVKGAIVLADKFPETFKKENLRPDLF